MLDDNKVCTKCGVVLVLYKNWPASYKSRHKPYCADCYGLHYNKKSNANRMWVNGKYIPSEHPLHKPGRYKSFGDAAFTALQKDEQVKEGYVYAICNPAWPDWVKIGMAIDANDRLNGYQTSSPMRDYILVYDIYFEDRLEAERQAHKIAERYGKRQGEWFKITREEAILVLAETDLVVNGE